MDCMQRPTLTRLLTQLALLIWVGCAFAAPPRVTDDRLKIELFAEHPSIVTPVGIAVDQAGRVLVIESNTHFRPKDYKGPEADRILAMQDTTGDGKADKIGVFYEGTHQTMNLAVHSDGWVYVATRRAVFRLNDTDNDGKADTRVDLVKLDTEGNYPHNGLSGFAFDSRGDVYFGFGENLGKDYKLIGSDGKTLSGGGEGGNIYACDRLGNNLRQVSTGFWNPFHLCFDAFDRLFVVENDPDSRPPCRLIHIVPGGDYGYKYRNGRAGLHPFTAWNGEVPGTLPMVAGTGEAPSGVLAYESDLLPSEYRGTLLATSWGDHRIERFRLTRRGASFVSELEPIVVGDENFRPVGIAAAPDGSLFVSDWVDRSYKLHGKGRVWRISLAKGGPAKRPDVTKDARAALASADLTTRRAAAAVLAEQGNLGRQLLRQRALTDDDPRVRAVALAGLTGMGAMDPTLKQAMVKEQSDDVRELAATLLAQDSADWVGMATGDESSAVRAAALRRIGKVDSDKARAAVVGALRSDDAFVRQAARGVLARSPDVLSKLDPLKIENALEQLGVVLAMRAAGLEKQMPFDALLASPHDDVRFAAIQWVGESRLKQHRAQLESLMDDPKMTTRLLAAVGAAIDLIDGQPASKADRGGNDYLFSRVALNDKASPAARAAALRSLRPSHPQLTLDRLRAMATGDDAGLAVEAVRSLRESAHDGKGRLLAQLADDAKRDESLRAAAAAGLDAGDDAQRQTLIKLAIGGPWPTRAAAFLALRGASLNEAERDTLVPNAFADEAHRQWVARALDASFKLQKRPAVGDVDAWVRFTTGPASASRGERVFFHPRGPGCYKCHTVRGRGGDIGPDLSVIARSLDRRKLIESMLQPAKEVAPRWQTWRVETHDDRALIVTMVGLQPRGGYVFADANGTQYKLLDKDIKSKQAVKLSVMPTGLIDGMTDQELRDLMAYLLSLK